MLCVRKQPPPPGRFYRAQSKAEQFHEEKPWTIDRSSLPDEPCPQGQGAGSVMLPLAIGRSWRAEVVLAPMPGFNPGLIMRSMCATAVE
jgi:hypothetical protein